MAAPKWLELANEIRDQVAARHLRPGDRLPSMSQLCAAHQVSATVVRNAMLQLRAEGVIEGRPGVGVFVRANPPVPSG